MLTPHPPTDSSTAGSTDQWGRVRLATSPKSSTTTWCRYSNSAISGKETSSPPPPPPPPPHTHTPPLPVCRRYSRLCWSTGKKPVVAPYSGHMLEMVARSAMDSAATPGPKNSTNLPTTPIWRRCCERDRMTSQTCPPPRSDTGAVRETKRHLHKLAYPTTLIWRRWHWQHNGIIYTCLLLVMWAQHLHKLAYPFVFLNATCDMKIKSPSSC